jgi:hypothetical protein
MKRAGYIARGTGLALLLLGSYIGYSYFETESDISAHAETVNQIAIKNPSPDLQQSELADLPAPVQAYFKFTFPDGVPSYRTVEFAMEGQFRRPLTDGFEPTTAEQTIAVGTPALVFSATTPILPLIWARAYDAYVDGKMDMKAKVLSTLTVMEEKETPELNKISLRRWLIESPVYPMALLPGGPVRWEAIDDHSARAIVTAHGQSASMVAKFRPDGSLEHFRAEEDGDLSTPYHGSGEYVLRSDYRNIENMMIPHQFTLARVSEGELYPSGRGGFPKSHFIDHRDGTEAKKKARLWPRFFNEEILKLNAQPCSFARKR